MDRTPEQASGLPGAHWQHVPKHPPPPKVAQHLDSNSSASHDKPACYIRGSSPLSVCSEPDRKHGVFGKPVCMRMSGRRPSSRAWPSTRPSLTPHNACMQQTARCAASRDLLCGNNLPSRPARCCQTCQAGTQWHSAGRHTSLPNHKEPGDCPQRRVPQACERTSCEGSKGNNSPGVCMQSSTSA